MSENLCLATCFLPLNGPMRQVWLDLDRELEALDTRLVLAGPFDDGELPFPVLNLPSLMKYYADSFPGVAPFAGEEFSPEDMDLAEIDCGRAKHSYSTEQALHGLDPCRTVMRSVLHELKPAHVLLWDNTTSTSAILQQLCWQTGVPVQVIERGLLPGTLMLDSRGIGAFSDLRTHWLAHEIEVDADAESTFAQAKEFYRQRKLQKYAQPEFAGGGPALREKLGLGGRKVVVLFGQSDSGITGPKGSLRGRMGCPAFANSEEALHALCGVVQDMPGTALVFKPHPIDVNPYSVAQIEGAIVVRDENVHALLDLADVIAAQFTTLQFEAAFYDTPILLLGRGAWWGRDATYEVDSPSRLAATLQDALNRRDWESRAARARAFTVWMLENYLIACEPEVPARRNIADAARFIARTMADSRCLPSKEERWNKTLKALNQLRKPPRGAWLARCA